MSHDESGSTVCLAGLIDQVGRATYALAFADGLNPAQWAALRYFDKAGPRARTVGGFAEFQGTTPGTASRTISVLIKRGYLLRRIDPADRRRAFIELTDFGDQMVARDPLSTLIETLGGISPQSREVTIETLESVLQALLLRRGVQVSRAADEAARSARSAITGLEFNQASEEQQPGL